MNLAARLADGISVSTGASTDAIAAAAGAARTAWHDAGRDEADLTMSCFVQVAVVDDGDDTAREAIKGLVMTHAGFDGARRRTRFRRVDGERPRSRIPREVEASEAKVDGEIDFYPEGDDVDSLIDRFAIVGSSDHCAERLKEIADLGLRRIYIGTRAVGVDLEERNTRSIGLHVLSQLR